RPRSGPHRAWTVATASGLVALAHWVNVTTVLFLGPVLGARWLAARADRRSRGERASGADPAGPPSRAIDSPAPLAWLLTLGGFAFGLRLKWVIPAPSTPVEPRPLTEWVSGVGELAENAWGDLGGSWWPATAAALAALGVALHALSAVRRGSAPAFRATLGLFGAALVGAIALGASGW